MRSKLGAVLGRGDDASTSAFVQRKEPGKGAPLHADEHEQLSGGAGQARQVRGGGIDEQVDAGVVREGARA
jgi:hypothetical protein